MTTQPTDEGKPLDENLNQTATTAEEPDFVQEDDPILAEMRAAEAEIAAAEAQGTQPPAEAPGATTPAATAAAPAAPKGQSPMVPKARLDEVLSERDLLRDQVGYLRGLNDAKATQAPATAAPATEKPATVPADQGGVVDEVEAAITAAEAKKLELAERYDNGEISSKQWKEEEIKIDKEIRGLSDKRLEKVREESRIEALNAVQTSNFETVKNSVGLQLQAQHPNVSVIDALPPAVSKGVWEQITDQAAKNLAAQGIKVSKDNAQSQLMLIKEKARLTDDLTPFLGYTPQRAPKAAESGQPGPKVTSEAAQNRKAKIDLANSQPPSIADMGAGANNAEITESDIENMTEDQVADLLTKAPQLVQRLVGGTQNRG